MDTELTNEQIAEIEAMIARRMDNTGETREQACKHIANWLRKLASL
jgi:hypothetical protein